MVLTFCLNKAMRFLLNEQQQAQETGNIKLIKFNEHTKLFTSFTYKAPNPENKKNNQRNQKNKCKN